VFALRAIALSGAAVLLFFALACTTDTCRTLCATMAQRIEGCLDDWGGTWEDFDVSERLEYGDRCRAEWETTRTNLEPRQLDAATEECTQAETDSLTLDCDELRALYYYP
jgi:hypothetical protein